MWNQWCPDPFVSYKTKTLCSLIIPSHSPIPLLPSNLILLSVSPWLLRLSHISGITWDLSLRQAYCNPHNNLTVAMFLNLFSFKGALFWCRYRLHVVCSFIYHGCFIIKKPLWALVCFQFSGHVVQEHNCRNLGQSVCKVMRISGCLSHLNTPKQYP